MKHSISLQSNSDVTMCQQLSFLCVFSDVSGEKETMAYFSSHFEEQLNICKKQVGLLFTYVYLDM